MNARYERELIWRFQRADEPQSDAPSNLDVLATSCLRGGPGTACEPNSSFAETCLDARERRTAIDAALRFLRRSRPVDLARVLSRRYGAVEAPEETRALLRENAAVATVTPLTARCFARTLGMWPRPRSNDVQWWLGALCGRLLAREASSEDVVNFEEVRRATEALVVEAQRAYEAARRGNARAH